MKVAFVTTYDAQNPATWSKYNKGNYDSSNYISKTLINQDIVIDYLGPLQKKNSWLTRSKWLFYHNLFKTDYYSWAEPIVCKNYASQVAQKLANSDIEIVLSPEGATPTAHLECRQPLIIWIDTILAELINFYPYLSNLCQETKNNIYAMEKAALEKCQLLIVTSDWAVETVVKTYGIESSKIQVIPRGANLELQPNRSIEDINNLIKSRGTKPVKLLFSGVDWQRKGGNIALEVAKKLNELGLDTELIVIGCQPISEEPLPSFVKPLGYIDKSKSEGLSRMCQLIGESHFLILPVQADINPNVLLEANAFGVPCLATNVAGIPTIIKDDINGKLFAVDGSIDDYCEYIINFLTNYQQYEQLAMSSFNEYLHRLNWSVAGQKAKKLFMELLGN